MLRWFGFLIVLLGLLVRTGPASATPAHINTWLNNAGTGALLLRVDAERGWQPALLLDTRFDVQVSGPVARVKVEQRFRNTLDGFAEGVYAFPLAERAGVHGMQMQIGERRIVGRIEEKARARQIFEQARAQGQATALVEQRRPNIFSTSVANIEPGRDIVVSLEYTELLVPDGTRLSLRLPLTMTPRYQPQAMFHPENLPVGPAHDLAAPEGPILPPGVATTGSHRTRLSLQLDAGQPLASLASPSHAIRLRTDGHRHRVQLETEVVPMDRDFVLNWQLQGGPSSRVNVFAERVDGELHALLMLMPGELPAQAERLPREVILIVDTSGSMQGERMRQARQSLIYALGRLQPEDRFNVLEFNHQHSMLYRDLQPANARNLDEAKAWVGRLQASGGTEMLPVLRDALAIPGDPGYLRQVIFITDGSVSNEADILALIERRRHRARLFTVGIGAAPNSYLLRKSAELGRGSYSFIADSNEVEAQMALLFERLEHPVLTDLRLELPEGIEADHGPQELPDLYAGQPLLVAMKLNHMPTHLTLHSRQGGAWQQRFTLPEEQAHAGVGVLWARQKIEGLMDQLSQGQDEETVRQQVLPVALKHRLLSAYTSFVAVDEVQVRPADQALHGEAVGNLNPVDHQYPQTSLGLLQKWVWALLLTLLAALLLRRRTA
jgi:Ca-activated chloride channel family protein